MAEYYALLADDARQRLWLQPVGAGWALPRLKIAERFWWQDVAPVNRAAREQLGCRVSTLQCAGIQGDEESGRLYHALVGTHKGNEAAIGLYQAVGFRLANRLRLYSKAI